MDDPEERSDPRRRSPYGAGKDYANGAVVPRLAPTLGNEYNPDVNLARDGYTIHSRRPRTVSSRPGEFSSPAEASREEQAEKDWGPYGTEQLED